MNKEVIKKPKKEFDCIKMKDELQAKIYKYIKGMTFDEQKSFMQKVIKGELKLN
ncbi:MAG: hypothetical protein IPO14_05010 [Saprospiraceae bacterium]|jgi:hypothetical protein|nr:hypothetical protein [Saprospiraceae bacterium]